MSERIKLGCGIFMWNAAERRTQQYGYFFLCDKPYNESIIVDVEYNSQAMVDLRGDKVKLTAVVLETRASGHAGDLYIDILPTTPSVGEEIVLGVGRFDINYNPFPPPTYEMCLFPSDGRSTYWLDPKVLYRLHDQTVELYAETTEEPDHLVPHIKPVRQAGKAISNGDGTIQIVGLPLQEGKTMKIKPNITSLGGGLFSFEMPNTQGNKGDQFDVEIEE